MDHPLIHEPFAKLLPVRTNEEREALRKQLKEEGCLDPLRVWSERNWLVDGHTRLEICEQERIPYEIKYLDFDDEEDATDWIVTNQLARRNLTDEQRAYFIGKQYLVRKKKQGGDHSGASDHFDHLLPKTAEIVAKENHVSAPTVRRNARFADAVDAHEAKKPGAKERILNGHAGPKKKIIETAPILCQRCRDNGAARNCKYCEEERSKKAGKPKPPAVPDKQKSGMEKADWRGLEEARGKLVRAVDAIFAALGRTQDRDHREANLHLNALLTVLDRVRNGAK